MATDNHIAMDPCPLFDIHGSGWTSTNPSYLDVRQGIPCFHCAIPRLVIYKPPGWEVDTTISPGPSSGRLLSAFLRDVLPLGPLGASHQFGFLHRLDLPSYLDWLILVGFLAGRIWAQGRLRWLIPLPSWKQTPQKRPSFSWFFRFNRRVC